MKRAGMIAVNVSCAVSCAASYQSARVVPLGKTEVTVAMSKLVDAKPEPEQDGEIRPTWTGDLQLRRGIRSHFDIGFRFIRTQGVPQFLVGPPPQIAETLSSLSFEPKLELTEPGATTIISVALPVYRGWFSDAYGSKPASYAIAPTLFAGFQLSSQSELVLTAKAIASKSYGSLEPVRTALGGSVGVRFGSRAGGFAIQPEIGVLRSYDQAGAYRSGVLISFGLGIAVGN